MKIFKQKYILLFFATLLLSSGVNAQKLSVKTNIDHKNIYIGDQIKYHIEISYSKNVKILWPSLPDTFGSFELISKSKIDSSFQNGNIIKKQTINITSFDSGTHVIPSFDILFRKVNDTAIHVAQTDSFIVNVNLIKVDTSRAIRPIKAPVKMPVQFHEILPYLLIFTGIVIIVLVVFYFIRKSKRKPLTERASPKIPSHILALEKLKNLEEQKLWQKGEVKKFHIELTDIIREYIEHRFSIPALESITEEIITDLKKIISDSKLLEDTGWFLNLSDLVKFAKVIPLPDENEKCLKISYEFVEKTTVIEKENQIDGQVPIAEIRPSAGSEDIT